MFARPLKVVSEHPPSPLPVYRLGMAAARVRYVDPYPPSERLVLDDAPDGALFLASQLLEWRNEKW